MNKIWGSAEDNDLRSEILVREPSVLEEVDNRIYFYAEIDRENILQLNKSLREKSNLNIATAIQQESINPVPIYLHILSYGGNIFTGLAAMDEILKSKVDIYTIVDGCCASAATFLSVVGKKRFIKEHAFMLIHQLTGFMWGKYSEMTDSMQNFDHIMKTIKTVYKRFTKVPEEQLDGILDHDIWWDAETCLKYGLVDEII